MYICTFYSFKGGVGRSLALVNVACELAKRGRRVLLVDFDLEAPGLETFSVLRSRETKPGLVEYINEYMKSGCSPNVRDYVQECINDSSDMSGRLWLMSSGGHENASYGDLFGRIDWQTLYERHDGYLMFEDLKLQWKAEFSPDYVLVDSRTGHTDVGGICTRQLPDSVMLFFFPNEQNLRGLAKVAQDIRTETTKEIFTHFVMANVPALDDELGILKRQVERATSVLGCDEVSATVHHYDNLSLLEQEVFVLSRPNTKLAEEYRDLADLLIRDNLEDRDGVEKYLDEISFEVFQHVASQAEAPYEIPRERMERITSMYPSDADILTSIAMIYDLVLEYGRSIDVLHQLEQLAEPKPTVFFQLGRLLRFTQGASAYIPYIEKLFAHPKATFSMLQQSIQWVRESNPRSLDVLVNSDAFAALTLEQQADLLELVVWDGCEHQLARFYDSVKSRTGGANPQSSVSQLMTLAAIALHRFREAVEWSGEKDSDDIDVEIARRFNLAMASWGSTQSPSKLLFERVLECLTQGVAHHAPNFLQCLGIAYRVTENTTAARIALQTALDRATAVSQTEFSAWRYRQCTKAAFIEDIKYMLSSLEESEWRPPALGHGKN